MADHQRHQRERWQQRLQEGELDLERMLGRMRGVGLDDKIGEAG
jgi:hypothetical protein